MAHYYEGVMTFINASGGGGGFGHASFPPSGTSTQSSTDTDGALFNPSTLYHGEVTLVGANPGDLAGLSVSLDTAVVYPPGTTGIGWGLFPPNGSNASWAGSFVSSSGLAPNTRVDIAAKAQGISAPDQLVTVTWWFDPDGWNPGCTSPSNVFANVVPVAGGTASGPFWNGIPQNPGNITDGNGGTGSVCSNGVAEGGPFYAYWTMDLGADASLTQATLTANDFSQACLSLQASADGISWTTVVSGAAFAAAQVAGVATVGFGVTTARYWRLVHTVPAMGLGTPHGVTVWELSALGCIATSPILQPPPIVMPAFPVIRGTAIIRVG